MAVNLGDLPTWFADIGTVGALGAALWQIRTERNLRHKRDQKEQASAPPRAGKAHFRCHRTRRPDGQAVGPTRAHCDLPDKRLPEPVYRLVIAIVAVQGLMPRTIDSWLGRDDRPQPITTASILPGGTYRAWVGGIGWAMGSGFNRPGIDCGLHRPERLSLDSPGHWRA